MESQRGGFWPGLRSLTCDIGWDVVPFISLFFTPTITNLDLTLPHESNRLLQPTLSLLAHTCRQLQSLTMNVGIPDALSGGEMGRLVSASRHTLRRIDIRSFTPSDVFPAIFNLSQLQDLSLQEPSLPNQVSPKALPHLQAINFNGNHGLNLTQFLRGLSVTRLARVTISRGGTIQLSTLLEPLCGATAVMRVLYLSPVAALDPSSITLLRSFTNLTSLILNCVCKDPQPNVSCSFQPTDESVQELGGALPRIRLLSLSRGCRGPRHVTFASLICLSMTCSNLENLLIRVDFTSIVSGPDQLNHRNPSLGTDSARPQRALSKLNTLDVGNSPLPQVPRCEWMVALALVRIFPSVRLCSSHCPEETRKRWEEVQEDVLGCQRIFGITQAAGKRVSGYI